MVNQINPITPEDIQKLISRRDAAAQRCAVLESKKEDADRKIKELMEKYKTTTVEETYVVIRGELKRISDEFLAAEEEVSSVEASLNSVMEKLSQ